MASEQEEPGEGFTVRDRRRVNTEAADAPPAADAAAETGTTAAPEEAPPSERETEPAGTGDAGDTEDGSLPDVYSVLAMFLAELRALAWMRMGLISNPATGQFEKDMAQAKVAIDTAAFLAKQLEPTVPAEERLPLRAIVSDLQINFVEQSKKG